MGPHGSWDTGKGAARAPGVAALDDLRTPGGGFIPGAGLVAVARCRREGRLDDETLSALAGRLGRETSELEWLASFLERLLEPSDDGSELHLCRGTSCTMNGAPRFHELLRRELLELGCDRPLRDVYCLSQCESGPNVMLERSIYCGSLERVVRDERRWRDGGCGPVSVGDDSVPVLD